MADFSDFAKPQCLGVATGGGYSCFWLDSCSDHASQEVCTFDTRCTWCSNTCKLTSDNACPATNSPPSATISSVFPSSVVAGSPLTVYFSTTNSPQSLRLAQFAAAATYGSWVSGVLSPSATSYTYTTSITATPGSYFLELQWNGGGSARQYFTISAPVPLGVITSLSETSVIAGTSFVISYTTTGGAANILLAFFAAGANTGSIIATGLASSGGVTYTIPSTTAPGSYFLQLQYTGVGANSDNTKYITVTAAVPLLQITSVSPQLSTAGSFLTVSWDSFNNAAPERLFLCLQSVPIACLFQIAPTSTSPFTFRTPVSLNTTGGAQVYGAWAEVCLCKGGGLSYVRV